MQKMLLLYTALSKTGNIIEALTTTTSNNSSIVQNDFHLKVFDSNLLEYWLLSVHTSTRMLNKIFLKLSLKEHVFALLFTHRIDILGIQLVLSSLRYFAKTKASSLMRVSIFLSLPKFDSWKFHLHFKVGIELLYELVS